MPKDRLIPVLDASLRELRESGRAKGAETVFTGVVAATAEHGPRYLVEGHGQRPFLRMNSNGYLGMSLREEVLAAEEQAVRAYGTGPGAVRFISGTWQPHLELEAKLAAFHGRESAMIFSSAYATIMGVLPALLTPETIVISDELNHNCIINALRLARPCGKVVYPHNDMAALEQRIEECVGKARRLVIVTDGIFSMRGDHAPLERVIALARRHDQHFPENVIVVVDDSHGVGAFGETGRGTEEHCSVLGEVDVLVATLGKAFGVNGGYVTGDRVLTDFLRESSPFYIYSNPITAGEAAAAGAAVELLDSARGRELLAHLRAMTARLEAGLVRLGYETIHGAHPVVPLMVRDTAKTAALVQHLFAHGVLATGLNFPVVPKGDEEIRFQVSAEHSAADIDEVLDVLEAFPGRG